MVISDSAISLFPKFVIRELLFMPDYFFLFFVIEIMNKNFYRIVWNRTLGMFQVASEMARTEGKPSSTGVTCAVAPARPHSGFVGRLALLASAVLMAWGGLASVAAAQTINSISIYGVNGQKGINGVDGKDGDWSIVRMFAPNDPENGGDATNATSGTSGAVGILLRSSQTYINNGSITGGDGGDGGAGGRGGKGGSWGDQSYLSAKGHASGGNGSNGGSGGNGANAVEITGTSVTLINTKNIVGGSGGKAGTAGVGGEGGGNHGENWGEEGSDGVAGTNGLGGYGIYVNNVNSDIINSGIISAGADGDGAIRRASIMYSSGANNARLELQRGSDIRGVVDARLSTGTKVLALGAGDGNYQGSFDVTQINNKYLGFNAFSK
ncbi:hypothetical protein FHW66_004271, partial [Herbaspirillum sp. Sphag64]|uniref:ESPR domain-containing protein n=2 Tax=unclassified Herbaspirillum TaxID=2624150 RepID=UPI00183708C8|nr:hypothetical protein [Herbaspirillum sp. Sphag64]